MTGLKGLKGLYTIPASFLNGRLAVVLLSATLIIGILGFRFVEGYSWLDAFYMTMITISTVGYTEVEPLTSAGKLFTSLYIGFNVVTLSYILAVFSYYIIQGEIFKNMHLNLINNQIDRLSDHIIICGYGRYGLEAAVHLRNHDIKYVIVEANEEVTQELRESSEKELYVEGDATNDEVLIRAGIHRAVAIISALPDDSDNVFVVLSARQLNPLISIISRAKNPKTEKKLKLAGANHVVLPDQIGGFYMATLVTKPGALDFLTLITSEYRSDIGIEMVKYDDLPKPYRNKSIRDIELRQATGTNIIGFRNPDGQYIVNPEPDTLLEQNTSLIVLGNKRQLELLEHFLKRKN